MPDLEGGATISNRGRPLPPAPTLLQVSYGNRDDIAQCSIEGDEQEMWAEMRRGRTWAAAGDMIMKT